MEGRILEEENMSSAKRKRQMGVERKLWVKWLLGRKEGCKD